MKTHHYIIGALLTVFYYVLYVLDNIILIFTLHPRRGFKTFSNTPVFIGDAIIRVSIFIFVYLLLWLLM